MGAVELKVLESEQSYRLFFESNPLPMWIYDSRTLAFLAVNLSAIEYYGYSQSEFLRMTLKDIRPEREVDRFIRAVSADQEGQLVQKGIWTHKTKSGREILVEVTTCCVHFQNRAAKLALVHDITERERTRSELIEWMNCYDAAIKASGQILYDWNLGTNKIAYHGDVEERLGYSKKELESGLERLVHPEDRAAFRSALDQAIEEKSRFALEYRVATRNGGYIWLEDVGHWVKNDAGRIVRLIGFLNDVTDRRTLEAQLRQAQKMEAVGRLAGGVAHDFNNLLGVIIGYSQLISEGEASESIAKHASNILNAGQRAAALTRQLLLFSRQQSVNAKVLDVRPVITNLESMLARMIGEDIHLKIFLHSKWMTKADSGHLEQVIMNLVINARDAMPHGGTVTIETSDAELDPRYAELHPPVSAGKYVQIVISDTGMGMDAETRSHIFEPFFTTKERGTGLGLATVYGIVKQSGGAISVYSELGRGAAFKIYLPATAESVAKEQSSESTQPLGGSETILVAEDDTAIRELIREVLREKGYTVLLAEHGTQAVEITEKSPGPIDLLLTDSIMPGTTGSLLAEQVRRKFPEVKVIMMSGYTDRSVTTEPALASADMFLQKPFINKSLLTAIRRVLDGKSNRY